MFPPIFSHNAREANQVLVFACCLLTLFTCPSTNAQQTNQQDQRSFEALKVTGKQRSKYLKNVPPSNSKPQESNTKNTAKQSSTPKADLETFKKIIQPILTKSCIDCHGPDSEEGNVRIDKLNPDLINGQDVSRWLEVFAVISNGEMPPPDEMEMPDEDRSKTVEWLSKEIQIASNVRRSEGNHSSFRRMTRYEFDYALRDLLGLPWNFAKDLPPEANSPDGFQNSSEMLHMSVSQLETYRELARQALTRATVFGERPPSTHWGVSMKDAGKVDWKKQNDQLEKLRAKHKDDPEKQKAEVEKQIAKFKVAHKRTYYKELSSGRTVTASWSYPGAKYANAPLKAPFEIPTTHTHAAILPQGGQQRLVIELGDKIPDSGIMRVRVKASRATKNPKKIPSIQLEFGWQASNEGRAQMLVSKKDTPVIATSESPQIIEWHIPLDDVYPRNSVRKRSTMGVTPSPSEYIRLVNSSLTGGDLRIDYVEVTAPFFQQWPPQSHHKIFIESENRNDESAYAREVLLAFMSKAWRREVTDVELSRKIRLLNTIRDQCGSFEEAMVEVLATVIASPNFLYVTQNADPTGHEFATRLSMFLWSSIPDEQLLTLAEKGKLKDPKVLDSQVQRMLRDPRSKRLSEKFVHQWLHLQILDFLDLKQHFPQFRTAKSSMQREPIEFFHEVLKSNGSILDFIHSDFAVVDERLARHYGIKDIRGNHFRKVKIADTQKRGGILTQAATLTMNADGKDSHPLKRGIWLLESILNDPPPPPPPNVPEIDLADPEIAKMTLKERIENHRNHAACRSCHSKIDPWGIAFENYDAVGRWRTSVGGKPVDANSKLFNKQKIDGMDGLKRYLLEYRQDQFVRAVVYKLATYALGRPLTFADRSSIDKITTEVRKQDDQLAKAILLIVQSELFRSN